MADDPFKTNAPDDEEYRPSASDSEGPTSSSVFAASTAGSKSHIFEKLKRKNIFMAIGVVVGIIVAYKMVDLLFMSGNSRKPNVAVSQPNVTTTPQPPTVEVVRHEAPSVATPTISTQVSELEQQSAHYQVGFDKVNAQMTEIQTAVSTMNGHLDEINTALQALATQVAQQQAVLEAEKKAKTKTKVKQKMKLKPVYFVRALVPGRAWLATSDGETITVGLGDNLPGYGVVQMIDANQGTITTNTGAIIGYSPNER